MNANNYGKLYIPVTNNYKLTLNDKEEKGDLIVKLTSEQIKELGSNNVATNYTNLFVNPKTSIYGISMISENETQAQVIDVQLAGMGEGDFTDLSATPLNVAIKNSIQPRRYKIYTQNAEGKIELSYQNVYFVFFDEDKLSINISRVQGSSSESYFEYDIKYEISKYIHLPTSSVIDYVDLFDIKYNSNDTFVEYLRNNIKNSFSIEADFYLAHEDNKIIDMTLNVDLSHSYRNTETMLLKDNVKNALAYDVLNVFIGPDTRHEAFLVNLDLKSKLNIDIISAEVTEEQQEIIRKCLIENYAPVTISGLTWDNYDISVRAKADTVYNEVGKGIVIDITDKSTKVTWKLIDSIDDVKYAE